MSHPIPVCFLLLGSACATSGNGDGEAPDTAGVAPVHPAGATAAPPVPPSHPLAGNWRLARTGQARGGGPGIRVELTIDSVPGDSIHGRVTHLFAGNVGLDAGRYAPLLGSVDGDRLTMEARARDDEGRIAFGGQRTGDTIRLSRFVFGADEMGGEWLLVRS